MTANGANIVCMECGASFYVPKGRLNTARFCSNSCRGASLGKERRGVPLSLEYRKAISRGRIGMTFSEEHKLNIALSRIGTNATNDTRAKLSQMKRVSCNTPGWRKRMSLQTTNGWKDPNVRRVMLEGQQAHFTNMEHGNNFPVGTPQSELDFAPLLHSAGYTSGYVIPTHRPENNGGGYYKLDYAHVEAKIDIEIDGSSHRDKNKSDMRRDAFMRALGWKIIRIKV